MVEKLGKLKEVEIDKIKPGKIRTDILPCDLYQRVKKIYELTFEVQSITFSIFEENFRRDLNPLSEIIIWERITKAYNKFISDNDYELQKKDSIFLFLIQLSTDSKPNNYTDDEYLTKAEKNQLYVLYTSENIEEFSYYIVFFSFKNEYVLKEKFSIIRQLIKRLTGFYFPNTSLPFSSNAIILKQKKDSNFYEITNYIEDALLEEDSFGDEYNQKSYIVEDISFFVIPVLFKDIKKYLTDYKDDLLDLFKKIKIC